jgi:hypothetical protein
VPSFFLALEPNHSLVKGKFLSNVFRADIGDQSPEVAAEIEELRWITRAEASDIEVAPLAAAYFLPEA